LGSREISFLKKHRATCSKIFPVVDFIPWSLWWWNAPCMKFKPVLWV